MFDPVIYDEASQMPVECRSDALPRSGRDFRGREADAADFLLLEVESDEADLFDGEMPDDDASEAERRPMRKPGTGAR